MKETRSPLDPHWDRAFKLLERAASLPASERDIFISAECGGDEVLRKAIYEHLLAKSEGRPHRLPGARPGPVTSAVNQALSASAHERRAELIGAVLGDYRLTAIIGAGGAGTVYLGERADRQYSAQVAIKVVANTLLNHEVQRRFVAERQILANLNHPYIARLLDAGETYFDEAFLVMEYVHGEPIDRYCDNQRLSVKERIQLFIKVCEAVQYAHRNLVVHRDLKPGNILVSHEGMPKLLDFGIAKLLDDSAQAILEEGIVPLTRVHDRLLTPEYASPEQIRGKAATTPSDVYSLGVILYELLTGMRPYPVNSSNQLELERSICIQDAIKPSHRVAGLANQVAQFQTISETTSAHRSNVSLVATARNTTLKKLQHQLLGDLDAILLRALRKEPEHRYSSVEHLIEDLNRYLTQLPVEARQGNRWYYTQRFVHRHAVGVVASTLAVIGLISVSIILSIQAQRLTQQRDIAKQQRDLATQQTAVAKQEGQRAESVSNFMLDVFTAADPFETQDKQVTARELLDKAAQRIESTLDEQPAVKARLLEAIGRAYGHQGQIGLAITYLEKSLSIQRTLTQTDTINFASSLDWLGRAYYEKNRFDESERALNEARSLLENTKNTQSHEYIQTLLDSGLLEQALNRLETAHHDFELGLTLSRKLYGNNYSTASMLFQLSQVMIWQGDYEHAEQLSREAVEIYHAIRPEKNPNRVNGELGFGNALYHRGKYNDAATVVSHALDVKKALFGADSSNLLTAYEYISLIQLEQKQWNLAEANARTQLSVAEKNLGSMSFGAGHAHGVIANVLLKRKKYIEAENEARTALKILKATAPADHQYTASAEYSLANALVALHRGKEAEPMLRENLTRWVRAEAPAWRITLAESLLGAALLQLHQSDEAGKLLTHADQVLFANDSGAPSTDIGIVHKRFEEYQQCVKENRVDHCQLTD